MKTWPIQGEGSEPLCPILLSWRYSCAWRDSPYLLKVILCSLRYHILGGTIPAQTGLFIALGNGLKDGFVIAVAVLAILVAAGWLFKRLGLFRASIDRFKVVNPITGSIYKKIIASRFSGALSLTLKSGMNLTEGFGLVSGVLDNSHVARKIKEAVNAVSSGKPFWEALKDTGLFPALFVRLVRTGEKTGSLDAIMEKVSQTWQEEANASLDRVINSMSRSVLQFFTCHRRCAAVGHPAVDKHYVVHRIR